MMMMMVLVLNKVDPPTIAATNIVDTYEGLRQDTIQRFHCTGGMHIVACAHVGCGSID